MEDERIGRAIKSSQTTVALQGVANEKLVGPNAKRVRLVVWCDVPDQVGIAFEPGPANAANRLVLRTTNMPLVLDIKDYGDVLTKQIFALDSVGGANVTFIEGSLTQDKV